MNNLALRFFSALIFVLIIFLLYFYLNVNGLKLLVFIAPVLGGLELIRILLPVDTNQNLKIIFYICLQIIFWGNTQSLLMATSVLSLVSVLYIMVSLLLCKDSTPLEKVLNTITRAIFGFLYLGVFPAFVFKLLEAESGALWFSALLVIVFWGDIGAYLMGSKWGKRKILPRISPNKSLEGVIGGLIGSLLGGLLFFFILPNQNLVSLLLLSLIVGGIAQYGDYLESLMKRVADTKDSGTIMPGHGGILDRIDGVLFAAPIVFIFVQFFK